MKPSLGKEERGKKKIVRRIIIGVRVQRTEGVFRRFSEEVMRPSSCHLDTGMEDEPVLGKKCGEGVAQMCPVLQKANAIACSQELKAQKCCEPWERKLGVRKCQGSAFRILSVVRILNFILREVEANEDIQPEKMDDHIHIRERSPHES